MRPELGLVRWKFFHPLEDLPHSFYTLAVEWCMFILQCHSGPVCITVLRVDFSRLPSGTSLNLILLGSVGLYGLPGMSLLLPSFDTE